MAALEDLEAVHGGAVAIDRRRAEFSDRPLDLHDAELAGIELPGADLSGAALCGADLQGADLRAVRFHRATLKRTKLDGANLQGAVVVDANMNDASLCEANLFQAQFMRCELIGTNLLHARCGETVFGDVDLSKCKGLGGIRHLGPSSIGAETLFRSRGDLPIAFLRGCGLPEVAVKKSRRLAQTVERQDSCFLIYHPHDAELVRGIHDHFQVKGVRCWLLEQTDEPLAAGSGAIRPWDRVLFCASRHSLVHPSAVVEIDAALHREEVLARTSGINACLLNVVDLDGALASSDALGERKVAIIARTLADFHECPSARSKAFTPHFEHLIRAAQSQPDVREQLDLADRTITELRRRIGRKSGLISGFGRLVKNDGAGTLWYNYTGNKVPCFHLRQLTAGNTLVWETEPVEDNATGDAVFFVFSGSLGDITEPDAGGFAFRVGGRTVLDFDVTLTEAIWQSDDKQLSLLYWPLWTSGHDSAGFFYVAVSRDLVNPGERCRFSVRSKGSDSLRWFALQPVTETVELQTRT